MILFVVAFVVAYAVSVIVRSPGGPPVGAIVVLAVAFGIMAVSLIRDVRARRASRAAPQVGGPHPDSGPPGPDA